MYENHPAGFYVARARVRGFGEAAGSADRERSLLTVR
jgi:hypothetical protein